MDVWLRSGIRHITFLGYQRICSSFLHKAFTHKKDTQVPSYIIFTMSRIVMRSLIWRRTSQVGRRPKLWREFISSTTQMITLQLMKLLYLTREIKRSRHWQVLYVSLKRINITSILHRNRYYDVTLDWDILGSNICNGWFIQGFWRCKEIPVQWVTVKWPSVMPVGLERVIVNPIN